MRTLTLTVIFLFALASCQVQQRKYQKGFYFSRSHHKTIKNSGPAVAHSEKQKQITKPEDAIVVKSGDVNEMATADNQAGQILLFKKRTFVQAAEDSCDVLLFKDGSEVKAKVMEVGTAEIKYKRCDNPNGPSYVTKKSDLFMIKYANGTRELIKEEKQQVQQADPVYKNNVPQRKLPPQTTYPSAILALIMGILAVFLPLFLLFMPISVTVYLVVIVLAALLATILGKTSIKRIREAPELYRGKGMATTGFIMGLVMLCIYFLIGLVYLLILLSI